MIFKFLGLSAVLFVCSAFGFVKALSIKKRTEQLNGIFRSITILAEHIKADGREITVLLPLCFTDNFIHINGQSIDFDKTYLEKEDICLLNEFFENLGFEDRGTEYERTTLYASLFHTKAQEAETKAQGLCRLYSSLGVLVGVFLCIFLM